MNEPTLTDRDHEELRLLYSVSASDIAFFKQQQWSVTNYALLSYAAIVTIGKHFLGSTAESGEKLLLTSLALLTAVIVGIVLCQLHDAIEVRRDRLKAVRDHFGQLFNRAWAARPKKEDWTIFL